MAITDPKERMAHAREQMLAKAIADASAQAAVLGLDLTPEQAEEAGRRLLKRRQQERLAVARQTRWANQQAQHIEWATTLAHRYAKTIGAFDPTMAEADILRSCLMVVADELASSDGIHRPRLARRFELYLDTVKADARERSRVLTESLVEPVPNDLPTLDDIALENGEKPWSER